LSPSVAGHPYRLVVLSALIASTAVVVISATLVVTRGMGTDAPALARTQLDERPAPDFTLTDHRGEVVSLSDFRGQAVALTFIYTHCPDVCPLTAENLRTAYELLPEDIRDDVALLAVTVDPARDTQQALQQFSALHGLADNPYWFALRGDPETLTQVWRDYGIYPGMSHATPAGTSAPSVGGGEGHTDALYFIDPAGRERAFLRSSTPPQDIAANLTAMLS
jgi:protein SCO1/2